MPIANAICLQWLLFRASENPSKIKTTILFFKALFSNAFSQQKSYGFSSMQFVAE